MPRSPSPPSLAALALVTVALAPVVAAAPPAPPPPAPGDVPQFHLERARVAGRLLSVHAVDLDADGRKDLLAIYTTGAPPDVRRFLALFLDHPGAGFRAAPDQILPVPPTAAFLDAADVDGDAKRELLFGDSRGLAALSLGSRGYGEPRRLATVEGLALLPDEEDLPFLPIARDWDGDGKIEILLPLVDRVAVFVREGRAPAIEGAVPTPPAAPGEWQRAVELRLPPRPYYLARSEIPEARPRNFELRVVLVVPELHSADFDGDGKKDLVAVLDDRVTVFRGQPGGLFSPTPAAKIHLAVRTPQEIARNTAQLHVDVLDLDGDGIADLAVNKISGGLSSMRSQTGFYLGPGKPRPAGAPSGPTQVLEQGGYAGSLLFGDLDGDKRPELVVCRTNLGFAEAARVVLTRHLQTTFEVHRNLGAKGFAPAAEAERPVDFAIDYGSANAELDGPFPSLSGDFNGDGLVDFAAPKGDGALGVWLGGGKGLLAEYPRALVHVPLARTWLVDDLDGDHRADALVYYRERRPELSGQIVVLRNTGRGW